MLCFPLLTQPIKILVFTPLENITKVETKNKVFTQKYTLFKLRAGFTMVKELYVNIGLDGSKLTKG